eukprot:SM000008S22308  [mRNA]  locus=s8:891257:891853:- [translate_table: standard]
MSAGGAFGGARGHAPQPPEKGVFPLDHFGECQEEMHAYMACLREHGGEAGRCRQLSKTYLQCRMSKNLMAEQKLSELGFSEDDEKAATTMTSDGGGEAGDTSRRRAEAGFIAGMPKRRTGSS